MYKFFLSVWLVAFWLFLMMITMQKIMRWWGKQDPVTFAKPNAQRNIFTFFSSPLFCFFKAITIVYCLQFNDYYDDSSNNGNMRCWFFLSFYAWPKLNKSERKREAQQLVLYHFLNRHISSIHIKLVGTPFSLSEDDSR